MPTPLLEAYVKSLPRVEAITSLRRVQEAAVGSGRVKPEDGRSIQSRWAREAGGKPQRRAAGVGGLLGLGLSVQREAVR